MVQYTLNMIQRTIEGTTRFHSMSKSKWLTFPANNDGGCQPSLIRTTFTTAAIKTTTSSRRTGVFVVLAIGTHLPYVVFIECQCQFCFPGLFRRSSIRANQWLWPAHLPNQFPESISTLSDGFGEHSLSNRQPVRVLCIYTLYTLMSREICDCDAAAGSSFKYVLTMPRLLSSFSPKCSRLDAEG